MNSKTKQGFAPFEIDNMHKKPFGKKSAFTLIEVVVIVAIIALMFLIVVPMLVIGHKRSKAKYVLDDLKALNVAVQQYAVETGRSSGFTPTYIDIKRYLDPKSYVYRSGGLDIEGNKYGPFIVDVPPKIPEKTFDYFSGVIEESFWSVYR